MNWIVLPAPEPAFACRFAPFSGKVNFVTWYASPQLGAGVAVGCSAVGDSGGVVGCGGFVGCGGRVLTGAGGLVGGTAVGGGAFGVLVGSRVAVAGPGVTVTGI